VHGDDWLVTAEEFNRIRVFRRTAENEFGERRVFPRDVHDGMIFCVEAAHSLPAAGLDLGDTPVFMSGGDEGRVRVWTVAGNFYPDLAPHSAKQIGSLSQLDGDAEADFVSGCWDGTVYIWNKGRMHQQLDGHQYSTQVLGLPGGGFVTGMRVLQMQPCMMSNVHQRSAA
jgi:WD40 repeat protein